MGTCHDQRFYATRQIAGQPLTLPFEPAPFNALIVMTDQTVQEEARAGVMQLLGHGMRAAFCFGPGSESLAELVDELVDENDIQHDGHTVYSSAFDDEESLDEALDYFILPNGLADKGLLVVFGDDAAFRQTIAAFARVAGDLRERLSVPENISL